MKRPQIIAEKIMDAAQLSKLLPAWRLTGKTVAFTNGCFDILHTGHIYSLSEAAREADYLVVGLNSDASTKKLKGNGRPVNDEKARATILAALLMVDAVTIFEEETPIELIKMVQPDVLVKGGDYTIDQIVGSKEVIAAGGRVVINKIIKGVSTSSLIKKIERL